MKVELNGRRFEVIAAIQCETEAVLDSVEKWEFQPERRWPRCAKSEGVSLNGTIPTFNQDKPKIFILPHSRKFWFLPRRRNEI